jgi:chromosome partitioning protein
MRRIAVANQKGGCGKTTTAVSLALCLKDLGQRVLLTDMDPQGSATQSLYPDKDSLSKTIKDLLIPTDSLSPADVILHIDENLDLLPSNVVLSGAEPQLSGEEGRESRLKGILEGLADAYDFVIIDSPPHVGHLTFNVLVAADEVIVPVDPSLFSLQGVGRIIESLGLLEETYGTAATYRVLATMYDSRTRISRELISTLQSRYKDAAFSTVIRNNITLKEATGYGVPITLYRGSRGFHDYKSLAAEILGEAATQEAIEIGEVGNFLAPRRIGGGVLFSYVDLDARTVLIEGDFNQWDGFKDTLLDVDGRGLWQRVVTLKPGEHRYRFVVDDRPAIDPNNGRNEFIEGKGLVSIVEI